MTEGIITKTGNSYAVRVPKSYITKNHLKLGDKVVLHDPLATQQKALARMVERATKRGGATVIKDPVAWQKQSRKATSPWEDNK